VDIAPDPLAVDESANDKLNWRVPVVAGSFGAAEKARIVVAGTTTLSVRGCGVLKLNAGHFSCFRTLYPAAEFAALNDAFAALSEVRTDRLPEINDWLGRSQ